MSNENFDSNELSKSLKDQSAGVGKMLGRSKRARRLASAGFKAFKKMADMFLKKVVLVLLKALVAFLGPVGIIILISILFLLFALQSVPFSDWFLRGGDRTPAEVLFDTTIQETLIEEHANIPEPLRTEMEYPKRLVDTYDGLEYSHVAYSQSWMNTLIDKLTPSWSLTGALFYQYTLKEEDEARDWHKDYKDADASDPNVIEDMKSDIRDGFGYLFRDDVYQLNVTYNKVTDEIVRTKRKKVCCPEEGPCSRDENETDNTLPARTIPMGASTVYLTTTTPLNVKKWTPYNVVDQYETGNCTITISKKYNLYLANDSTSINVDHDDMSILNFIQTAPEGKRTRRVHPKDLEFTHEIMKQMDPSISMDKATVKSGLLGLGGLGGFLGLPGGGVLQELVVEATAYTAYCDGCSGVTARGTNLRNNPDAKVIAVDPNVIPLGSQVYIEGLGFYVADDTGGAIKGNKIDIFVPDESDALAFGRKTITIKVFGSGGAGGAEAPPVVLSGSFTFPTSGNVNSGFGQRWGKLHAGIDIPGANKPIVSVADGVVARSYRSKSYGNCVIITHYIDGEQYQTLYAHMTTRLVQTGDNVSKGQLIGYSGNTGNSTGPHLHFEMHKPSWNVSKSNAVNPRWYIPFTCASGARNCN